MANWWTPYILQNAPRYGIDPRAALAVANAEGLSGGVGDQGTSFGPFQLHAGGALPSGRGRAWAESQAGINYALSQMGSAKGLTGRAAINAIVRNFERPADPSGEIARAFGTYGSAPGASASITDMAMGAGPKSRSVVGPPTIRNTAQSFRVYDPGKLAQGIFGALASGGTPDIGSLVTRAYRNESLTTPELVPGKMQQLGPPPHSNASPPPLGQVAAVTPKNVSKWAISGSGMDRSGVATRPQVFGAVARIAQIYGHPLTIGTGSNHREFVNNDPSGHRSDHWFGEAADVPMSGAALTRLGQAALIAAGMPAAQARKQTGGVFNVGGYNILFNTRVGGNHFNHLHVGLGRILGRPA